MIQVVSTGYKPRPLQAEIHRNLKRFNVLVCHRRFGKTHLGLNEMLDRGLQNPLKNPQYAYIAPTYGQAKRVAWEILKGYVKDLPFVEINESELRVDIHRPAMKDRVRIFLMGAENPDAARGLYLDGVVLDEYADMNPIIWSTVLIPALSDRQGWAIFIGTPKGRNHFSQLFEEKKGDPNWYCALFKASETGVLSIADLELAASTMSESEYQQEFECSFAAALIGAYYGKEIEKAEKEGRIGKVAYDPALPVFTYWDLGVSDTTTIWFAQVLRGREIRWIDYIEESGQGLPYYAKLLKERGYVYEEIVLPHDGAARELGTGKSRQETLQALMKGVRVRVVPRSEVADGINASRLMIAKSWFDEVKCKKGLDALKNYERTWDAKNKIFQERPKHNWASHGADGFRTGAMGMDENRPTREKIQNFKRYSDSDYKVV